MEKNVVILDIDYVTYENKPVIRLFSKDKDKNIVLLDDTFEPYLYVAPKDDDKECQKQILDTLDDVHIEEVIKKDFQVEKTFLKVKFLGKMLREEEKVILLLRRLRKLLWIDQ